MYSIQFNGDGAPMMALVISYCLSMLLSLGAAALILVSSWHIFKKLGMPGWKGIIPYYSDYMLFRTVWETKPFWVLEIGSGVYVVFTLIISLFLPILMLVNGNSFDSDQQVIAFLIVFFAVFGLLTLAFSVFAIVITLRLNIRLAKAFGKGVGFALGLTFLNVVFYPILAFGKAQRVN